jgi:hypothetical protein
MGENIYRTKVLLKKLKTLVKTRFASKVIMFEKCIELKKIIILFYGKQKTMMFWQQIPKAQV